VSFSENVEAYGNVRYISRNIIKGAEDIIESGGYFIINNNEKIQFGASQTGWNLQPGFHSYSTISENDIYIYILYNASNFSDNPITGTVCVECTKTTD